MHHPAQSLMEAPIPFVLWERVSVQKGDQLASTKATATTFGNHRLLRRVNVAIDFVCSHRNNLRNAAWGVVRLAWMCLDLCFGSFDHAESLS